MRDYLDGSWNFERCGNCGHLQLSHTNWMSNSTPPLLWIERCKVTHDGPIVLPVQCNCTEWVPKDNLDRIEYLAEKKGLVNG